MNKTPEPQLAASRKWKAKNKDIITEYKKRWNKENKNHVDEYNVKQYNKDPEFHKARRTVYARRERAKAIKEYGGKCACCGESTPEFLQFDHIHNDGAEHRKKHGLKGGMDVVNWLKKNRYPKDIIQLLCANCNLAKGFYGQCPHGNV